MKKFNPLFPTILLILLIPVLQQVFRPIFIYPLMGHYEVYEPPKWSMDQWMGKTFQEDFERYMNQNFGFRSLFVRFRNQLDWNLFREANARGVLVGKQDFLFEKGYINAYLGRDYLGDSVIQHHASQMEAVSQFFDRINTPLLLVIAPGKAWYFPELMPESVSHLRKINPSNYEVYFRELDQRGLRYIDFNRYFVDLKDDLGTLVFPKTGIHWSNYCAALALDSIARYSKENLGLAVPQYQITETEVLWPEARGNDKDLENSMNLLTGIDNFPSRYPKYQSDSTEERSRVLIISDSFYYPMQEYVDHVYDHDLWYYYDKHWEEDLFPENTYAELESFYSSFDMVMMLVTETGFTLFPWGYFEDVLETLPPADQLEAVVPSTHSRSSK